MKLNEKSVLNAIKTQTNRPMKLKELSHELGIPSNQYRDFRVIIKSLIDSGELVKLKRNRIGLASELDVLGPFDSFPASTAPRPTPIDRMASRAPARSSVSFSTVCP